MRKAAIKYSDLLALAKRHKVGAADVVLLDGFLNDAKGLIFGFTGVGRVNCPLDLIEVAERKVNAENRYCHTKGELAALLGVSRNTLYRWECNLLVTLKRAQPKRRFNGRQMYDAKDVLKQLRKRVK